MGRFRPFVPAVAYVLLDTLLLGFGMGVPILNIMLGFGVGWWVTKRALAADLPTTIRRSWRTAWISSAYTLLMLAVIWVPWLPTVFGPEAGLAKTGVPLILYEPRASFIGWLVLMVVISPLLQVLTTLASSFAVIVSNARRHSRPEPE